MDESDEELSLSSDAEVEAEDADGGVEEAAVAAVAAADAEEWDEEDGEYDEWERVAEEEAVDVEAEVVEAEVVAELEEANGGAAHPKAADAGDDAATASAFAATVVEKAIAVHCSEGKQHSSTEAAMEAEDRTEGVAPTPTLDDGTRVGGSERDDAADAPLNLSGATDPQAVGEGPEASAEADVVAGEEAAAVAAAAAEATADGTAAEVDAKPVADAEREASTSAEDADVTPDAADHGGGDGDDSDAAGAPSEAPTEDESSRARRAEMASLKARIDELNEWIDAACEEEDFEAADRFEEERKAASAQLDALREGAPDAGGSGGAGGLGEGGEDDAWL